MTPASSENEAMADTKQKEKFLKRFGAHVKKVRIAAGYSQDRVYLEGGLSRATMSRIEAGKVDAQIFTLARVAETLGIPLKKLIDFE
jgi:DNA-binding XRE family transcriptional regulator